MMRGRPRGGIVLYTALTFTVTWASWIVWGYLRPAGPATFFFFIGVFAPATVGLLLARAESRETLRDLLSQVGRWRVSLRWYSFAVLYIIVIKIVAASVVRVVGGGWPEFVIWPWYVTILGIAVSTPVQAGEEIGWRGYALPRLAERYGLTRASIVVGVIWAVWHLPLFFIPGTDTTGRSFITYLLQVTALSVAMGWLYIRSGRSLLVTMLMHSSVNNTPHLAPSAAAESVGVFGLSTLAIDWMVAALLWIGALYFIARMPKLPSQNAAERTKDERVNIHAVLAN